MTTNDINKDAENKTTREILADSRNTSLNRGRTRVKDNLDLDFDFDFKKKAPQEKPKPEDVLKADGLESSPQGITEKVVIPDDVPTFDFKKKTQIVDEQAVQEGIIENADVPVEAAEKQSEEPESVTPEADAVPDDNDNAEIVPEEIVSEEPAEEDSIEESEEPAEKETNSEEAKSEEPESEEAESEDEETESEKAGSESVDTEETVSEEEKTGVESAGEASADEKEAAGEDAEQKESDKASDETTDDSGENGFETVDYFYDDSEEEIQGRRKRFGLVPDFLRVPDEEELEAEADDDLDYLLAPIHPFSIKKKRSAVRSAYRKNPEKTEEGEETALKIVSGKVPLMKDNKSKAVARNKAKTAKSGSAAATKSKTGTAAKSQSKTASDKTKQSAGNKGGGSGGGNNNKGKKKKKQRNKAWIFVRSLLITFISLIILGGIAGGAYTAYVVSHAETIHPDQIYDTLAVSTYIYDDKETLIDEIYYNENRQIITYEQLPENLKNAFIAIEDKTFWTHKGFNFRRIIGAILERFHGGRISGTSTITQQLARNVFLPEDKSVRSIKRKIIEMYYAYEIEEELSKEEIITAYLNTIYLGYGCYGVDTAARKYFSVNVEKLSLEQCAALAALPQAPGSYALIVNEEGEHTTKIKKGIYANDSSESRRNLVLQLMYEQGYITEEQRDAATKPLADFIKPGGTSTTTSTSAFKDYLIQTVKNDLMSQYDLSEEQAVKLIYTKGLRIYSTLDSQAQKIITKEFKDDDNFPKTNKKKVEPEAAMVISEVGTGKIKAMVGSRNAGGQMLFNRATNPRQPGSSIKPLTVYSAALQKSYEYQKQGKKFKFTDYHFDNQGTRGWGDYITVSSTVVDEKMTVNGKTWPLNVTRTYSGTNTFRTAIQKSINTCAVKILAQVGINYSMDMLKSYGITSAVDDTSKSVNDVNYAALALGAMSEGISPLEMSLAYAAFPNEGVRNTGICYTRVEDNNGRTLLEAKSEKVKVMDKGVAYIMTNVLQSIVTNGIGYPAKVDGIKVGGKTGTTDSRYDIWFCGFTPSYSAALWIGTDENVQMDSYSEKAAALWGEIIGQVKRAKKGSYPDMPKNVYRAWNGEYYTTGTAPPEPEPEPEEEEDEDGAKGADGKTKTGDAAKETPKAADKGDDD